MSQPRVALVLPTFPVLSETFIVRQWLGLLDRGWDVHIACAHLDHAAWQAMKPLADRPELLRRVRVAPPSHSVAAALRRLPAEAMGLLRHRESAARHWRQAPASDSRSTLRRLYLDAHLVAIKPQLVHFEFGSLAPERMDLGRRLDARVVVSFRGFDLAFVGLDQPDYYAPVWRFADRLHFLGNDLRRRALARGCPESMPHELIPPAVDAELFNPPSDGGAAADQWRLELSTRGEQEPVRILSVGRLAWKKGYDYGLGAIHRLVKSGVSCTYTLVGAGREVESITHARRELGLEEVVHLTGPLPHDQVLEQMRQADIFLHPAVSEGFCNAVLEAQAMTLPVVTTDADGLPENVADGESGFVVPRRDAEALVAPLKRLATDPKLRRRMGQAGRRRVLEHFRPDQEIDGFERLYQRALEGPPRWTEARS